MPRWIWVVSSEPEEGEEGAAEPLYCEVVHDIIDSPPRCDPGLLLRAWREDLRFVFAFLLDSSGDVSIPRNVVPVTCSE